MIKIHFYDKELWMLKVSKSRMQFMVSSILPKNERNSLSWAFSLYEIWSGYWVSFVLWKNLEHQKLLSRFTELYRGSQVCVMPSFGQITQIHVQIGFLATKYIWCLVIGFLVNGNPDFSQNLMISNNRNYLIQVTTRRCTVIALVRAYLETI